ncbi:X-linked retinitis pigmentosa GTPase regulator-like isoform X2 [Bolinopsis microptera]|uniref:X-linked retinitis pigmentosa GTPase regulator-like isoform X2 n=1 Tax=Bolinopsis microptera TaxID=2820187 RepID=UPI00307A8D3E
MEEVPETGAVFTFGKSRFGDDNANKFWVKNDPVVAVACGDEHTAVVTSTGRSYTFGSNQWGQLALGHTRQTNKPSFVKSLKGKQVAHVACGRTHTLIATKSEVYGCGGNGEHQVNESTDDEVLTPFLLPTLSGILVKRLSCGVEHSLVLGHCGDVYLWGGGSEGQLGMGANVSELLKPTVLQFTDEKIKDASCGYYHTGLVTQSGKVFTFGENDNGKLGLGEDADDTYHVPQPVFLVDVAERICCGNTCTAVMTSSGGLYMCGDGQRGQLGFAPNTLTKCVYTLTKVPCPPIVDISVGEGHTAVVSKSGHLYTFGDGRHGKLCHGDNNFATLHSPYLVESFSTIATVQTVACGGCHTMVIAKAGRPFQDDKKVSTARSKRHGKGARLNDSREPPSLPAIKHGDDNKENNLNNIQIVQENVKTLESALNESPKKIVNLDKGEKKETVEKAEVDKTPSIDEKNKKKFDKEKEDEGKKKVEEKKKVDEKKKVEEKKNLSDKKIVEEDSGSETDEPGATSDVTDSEADSELEEEEDDRTAGSGGGGGFMDNIMSIDQLEPAGSAEESVKPSSVIQVKSSEVKQSKSEPLTKETVTKETDANKKPESARKKEVASKITDQPIVEESSEYETETDEEGEYEDETEDETEDEKVDKKEEPVKTLVGEMPSEKKKKKDDEITKDEPTTSGTNPKPAEEPAPSKSQKEPSKFMFWKKKPKKEEKPVIPATPGTQNSSKACVIL